MVDIHCHLLYGVDDGADDYDMSVAMLEDAGEQGITDMILTPHFRRGMFHWNKKAVTSHFIKLSQAAAQIGINLNIGCEYHADGDMVHNIRTGYVPPLAGSEYVLTEFGHAVTEDEARGRLNDLLVNGYTPVIAHAERYGIIQKDTSLAARFRDMGSLIQINAGSIVGAEGHKIKRVCRELLKDDLADIVASDSHDMGERCIRMEECRNFVEKKYGADRALKLFEKNPGSIVGYTNRLGI